MFYLFIGFWVTFGSDQGLLLALCPEITPRRHREPNGRPRIKPGWPYVRLTPYLLCYHSSLLFLSFVSSVWWKYIWRRKFRKWILEFLSHGGVATAWTATDDSQNFSQCCMGEPYLKGLNLGLCLAKQAHQPFEVSPSPLELFCICIYMYIVSKYLGLTFSICTQFTFISTKSQFHFFHYFIFNSLVFLLLVFYELFFTLFSKLCIRNDHFSTFHLHLIFFLKCEGKSRKERQNVVSMR